MLQITGIDAFLQLTEKLGVTTLKSKADYGLALALGAGEMKMLEHTAAFGVFANEGVKNDTVVILKVEDSKGKIIKEAVIGEGTRVVDEKEVYLLNYILCDLGGHGDRIGIGQSRVKGTNVCFKTGTTDGPKDLTTMMYHKNLVVGVWAGNNDNTPVPGAYGSTVPLPIAYGITNRLADIYKPELYTRPAGIVSGTVCRDTGGSPLEGVECEKEATVFISGRAPQVDSRKYITVCTANGLIPSNLVLAQGYGLVQQKTVLTFKLENKLQQATYEKYLAESRGYLFADPATGECPLPLGPDNAPVVEITTPANNVTFKDTDTINITGNTRQLGALSEFTISIDTTNVSGVTWSGSLYSASMSLSKFSAGNHTITVTAKDSFGKVGTKSISIKVEKSEVIPPITPPVDGNVQGVRR